MSISHQVENVFQRALRLRQQATVTPAEPELLDAAMRELYDVLEELRVADEELHEQNELLRSTRQEAEVERHRYRTLFEMAPDSYVVTNRQGRIFYANRAATALFNWHHDLLVGKPLLTLVAPGDRESFQQRLVHLPHYPHWQLTLQNRQGEPVVTDVNTTFLSSHRAEEATILWSLRDVTHRQQLEQQQQAAHHELECQVAERTAELAQVNAQLQREIKHCRIAEQTIRRQAALIDIATDAIYVKDTQQRIVFWNRGAETLYGWTAAEALGQDANALLTGSPTPPPLTPVSEHTWQGEVNHRTKAGTAVTVLSRCTQVQEADAFPNSTLVVNTDITEKKRLEAEFHQAQRLESLGTFARNVAHDLKNILNPLKTVPRLLLKQMGDPAPSTRKLLTLIESAADRGAILSQQILSFADDTPTELACLQVEEVLHEIHQFAQHTFPAAILVQVHLATGVCPVRADATLLYRALMNLCVNARDAMPDGGTLTLSLDQVHLDAAGAAMHQQAQEGDYVVLTVADTGMGMSPAVRDRLFDLFFTTKPQGRGTGIGLATVAKIVGDFDGFIKVDSQEGNGSQFQIYLPAAEPSAAA